MPSVFSITLPNFPVMMNATVGHAIALFTSQILWFFGRSNGKYHPPFSVALKMFVRRDFMLETRVAGFVQHV
jgi:hypothetical protein